MPKLAKTNPTDSIKNIKINNLDPSGNLIINVLASGNEFAIYEIDTNIPENRLRVRIDGITNEREEHLITRFNMVKQKYVLSKGLLYRSTNFNLMKSRVAHALASTLSGNDPEPNHVFQELIDEIHKEYKQVIWRRAIFILPGYLLLTLFAINALMNIYYPNYVGNDIITQVLKFIFATIVGGVLSMTYSVQKFIFETEPSKWFYFLLGGERISLALLAGIVVFVGMRSGFVFGEVITSNHFATLFVGFGAGFFETFIPNLLKKHASAV